MASISLARFPSARPVTRARIFGLRQPALHSSLIGLFIVAITDIVFLLSSRSFEHWFILPVSLCGILIAGDAIDWFRSRLDLYDPIGIIGVLGFHFFFLAPMLHVKWDFWMNISAPSDWRGWLGYMALLNAAGLVLYRIFRRDLPSNPRRARISWQIDEGRFYLLVPIFAMISGVLQAWVYLKAGGITAYMETVQDNPQAFKGMGWIFMISESAPILMAFFLIMCFRRGKLRLLHLAIALIGLFSLQMFFGGLRGSRSETVRLFFWAAGCFHLLVRRIPKSVVYAGLVFLIAFLYLYGFYKAKGMGATEAFTGSSERDSMAAKTGRTGQALILGDLGRADVQSFILYKLARDPNDFTYATGRTYLGAVSLLIPGSIMPDRPSTKLKEGTEIQYGRGSYFPEKFWSSRVYGLGGESMLNFGPPAVPIAYALFGLIIARFRKFVGELRPGDARFLLVPFGVYLCFSILPGDSDNLVFGMVKGGFLPLLVVWLCSRRRWAADFVG